MPGGGIPGGGMPGGGGIPGGGTGGAFEADVVGGAVKKKTTKLLQLNKNQS